MDIEEIIREAANILTPSPEERNRVINTADTVVKLITDGLLKRNYKNFTVTIQGSVAKDTWLPGDRDIDIFIILPRDYFDKIRSGDIVNDLIDVAVEYRLNWDIKYAQHPYVQLLVNDFEVDVVPCIRISPGERPFTAADRTPLHTDFVKAKLMRRTTDVRLLKAFLKSVGIYGAEIKVRGFSGYVSELLIIYYGSFLNAIRAISNWPTRYVFIDMTNTYNEKDAVKKFRSPVIIIDPVDPNRNAAASINRDTLATAIAASREFLRNPSIKFFTRTQYLETELKLVLPTMIVRAPYPEGTSPDIVWGEITRLMASLVRNLRKLGFRVIRSMTWSDDKSVILLMIMFEELELPQYEPHEGPPVDSDAAGSFIRKYINRQDIVGPFIRGTRWFVVRKRRFPDVVDATRHIISTISLKHLRNVLASSEYIKVKSINDIEVFNPSERAIVKEFLWSRPWWLA